MCTLMWVCNDYKILNQVSLVRLFWWPPCWEVGDCSPPPPLAHCATGPCMTITMMFHWSIVMFGVTDRVDQTWHVTWVVWRKSAEKKTVMSEVLWLSLLCNKGGRIFSEWLFKLPVSPRIRSDADCYINESQIGKWYNEWSENDWLT